MKCWPSLVRKCLEECWVSGQMIVKFLKKRDRKCPWHSEGSASIKGVGAQRRAGSRLNCNYLSFYFGFRK